MAEHRSVLKNYENTYYPRFSFTPDTGIAFLETGVLFLLWVSGTTRIWVGLDVSNGRTWRKFSMDI